MGELLGHFFSKCMSNGVRTLHSLQPCLLCTLRALRYFHVLADRFRRESEANDQNLVHELSCSGSSWESNSSTAISVLLPALLTGFIARASKMHI